MSFVQHKEENKIKTTYHRFWFKVLPWFLIFHFQTLFCSRQVASWLHTTITSVPCCMQHLFQYEAREAHTSVAQRTRSKQLQEAVRLTVASCDTWQHFLKLSSSNCQWHKRMVNWKYNQWCILKKGQPFMTKLDLRRLVPSSRQINIVYN